MSGRHPETLAGAAEGDPEPGLDLVEDQQRAVVVTEPPQPFEKPGQGHDPEGVAEHRLDDHRGDPLALVLEGPLHQLQVVEGQGADQRPDGLRYARARLEGDGAEARPEALDRDTGGGEEHVVVHPVVLALELDHDVAPGQPAGEPDGVHRRLGAGVGESHGVGPLQVPPSPSRPPRPRDAGSWRSWSPRRLSRRRPATTSGSP